MTILQNRTVARKWNNVQESMEFVGTKKDTGRIMLLKFGTADWTNKLIDLEQLFLALYKCLKLEPERGDLLFNRHFLNLEGKKGKYVTWNSTLELTKH